MLFWFLNLFKKKPKGIGHCYRDPWVPTDLPGITKDETMSKPIYRHLLDGMKALAQFILRGWKSVNSQVFSFVAWVLGSRAFFFFCMIACIVGIGRLSDVGDVHNLNTRFYGQIALGIMALASAICCVEPKLARVQSKNNGSHR